MDVALGRRRGHHVAIVILVILGWAVVAQAEDAPGDPAAAQAEGAPRAPAATRSLAGTISRSLPFVWALVRETRGKTLEQM
jgi:hypothetical protein